VGQVRSIGEIVPRMTTPVPHLSCQWHSAQKSCTAPGPDLDVLICTRFACLFPSRLELSRTARFHGQLPILSLSCLVPCTT
jgi:hypothetical protein